MREAEAGSGEMLLSGAATPARVVWGFQDFPHLDSK
jgi:hypothetical protein